MSYRFMRVLVFFDLPTINEIDKRNYRKFRAFLIKNGFMMLQESVYAKLVLNETLVIKTISSIKHNAPKDGSIHILTITEKQFSKMEIISNRTKSDVLNTDERITII